VDADPDIQELDAKIAYQEEKVDYLEQIVKGINNRQWNLNNSIQWRKFLNGVN
jgi:exonuclease VII small subunit